jgi:hypothetical protein
MCAAQRPGTRPAARPEVQSRCSGRARATFVLCAAQRPASAGPRWSAACVAADQRPPPRPHRRLASIVDTPIGVISLGAHRKVQIGRCQHDRALPGVPVSAGTRTGV